MMIIKNTKTHGLNTHIPKTVTCVLGVYLFFCACSHVSAQKKTKDNPFTQHCTTVIPLRVVAYSEKQQAIYSLLKLFRMTIY